MQTENLEGQESMFAQGLACGKTLSVRSQAERILKQAKSSMGRILKGSSKRSSKLKNHTFMLLDLRPGAGNMLGAYWEYDPPWLGSFGTLNTSECPKDAVECSLWQILQATAPSRYSLSQTACLGILRRAECRGKLLPSLLESALRRQAGLDPPVSVSGEHKTVLAFAANQRDEVRDLHNVAGALQAQQGMKQQTFVAGLVTKGNGDCFLTPEKHTALVTGGGQAGQGYPCVFAAGFSAGAGASAGTIGYSETVAPTLKGSFSGNCMPSVLCLNDQGGKRMGCAEGVSGTLRAQEHGHPPLVLRHEALHVYENHGIDARCTGPHKVAPTVTARYGSGGNNTPIVEQCAAETICIAGNIIDRQPQNGGNGFGCQEDIAYTITATDRHALFSRQRVDAFIEDTVASTESARQHKDATDLVYTPEPTCDILRRLTPLECERLQGFPDGWTDVPGASDAARYKALGNSVAIPCVELLMQRIAAVITLGLEWKF